MYNCGIYRVRNIINNYFYIGQSKNLNRRKNHHFASLKRGDNDNKNLQREYNEHGEFNFIFEILLYCEPNELLYYEQKLVDLYDPEYNICKECVNNTTGVLASEETKCLISKNHANFKGENHPNFGKKMSDEQKNKLSIAQSGENNVNYGKNLPEETKLKISIALSGEKNGMFGKHHTEETKKKMSDKAKGIPKSEETRKKMSAAQQIKREIFDETRKKQSESQKKRWENKRKFDNDNFSNDDEDD